jgi:hypothetical protein
MPDETPKAPAQTSKEAEKQKAINAYNDAATREAKAAVVKQYPFLADIFSIGNHN